MSDALGDVLGRLPKNSLRTARVQIVQTSPALSVQLPDGAIVPAQGTRDATYTVGGWAVAFLQEKAIPIVVPLPGSAGWTVYSPSLSWTLADGTAVFRYRIVGDRVNVRGRITVGASTTTGTLDVGVPVLPQIRAAYSAVPGAVNFVQAAGPTVFPGALAAASSSAVRVYAVTLAGGYVQSVAPAAAVPFVWAAGDYVSVDFTYDLV